MAYKFQYSNYPQFVNWRKYGRTKEELTSTELIYFIQNSIYPRYRTKILFTFFSCLILFFCFSFSKDWNQSRRKEFIITTSLSLFSYYFSFIGLLILLDILAIFFPPLYLPCKVIEFLANFGIYNLWFTAFATLMTFSVTINKTELDNENWISELFDMRLYRSQLQPEINFCSFNYTFHAEKVDIMTPFLKISSRFNFESNENIAGKMSFLLERFIMNEIYGGERELATISKFYLFIFAVIIYVFISAYTRNTVFESSVGKLISKGIERIDILSPPKEPELGLQLTNIASVAAPLVAFGASAGTSTLVLAGLQAIPSLINITKETFLFHQTYKGVSAASDFANQVRNCIDTVPLLFLRGPFDLINSFYISGMQVALNTDVYKDFSAGSGPVFIEKKLRDIFLNFYFSEINILISLFNSTAFDNIYSGVYISKNSTLNDIVSYMSNTAIFLAYNKLTKNQRIELGYISLKSNETLIKEIKEGKTKSHRIMKLEIEKRMTFLLTSLKNIFTYEFFFLHRDELKEVFRVEDAIREYNAGKRGQIANLEIFLGKNDADYKIKLGDFLDIQKVFPDGCPFYQGCSFLNSYGTY